MSTTQSTSLWFQLPDSSEIEFPPQLLAHFQKHQQRRKSDKEAGGQLFWEFAPEGHMRVAAVTGPRKSDSRSRTSYKADAQKEQMEIDAYYEEGCYFLGDWHTHPERIASPSSQDRTAIREIYTSSTDSGSGFILVIVGTGPIEECLSVSWCDGSSNLIPLQKLRK